MMEERIDLTHFSERVTALKQQIGDVIVGQEDAIELLLTTLIANGHALIEGVPGVAKTLLVKLIARLVDAGYARIQFTPDLMPSDVLGTTVYNMQTAAFEFRSGPIFSDIVLIDEINRAPAKTQSALFEVMEERQVTVDGKTHAMSSLFTVMATQNPVEQEGTYRLPEAQLDRFLMKIVMGYPSVEQEVEILKRHDRRQDFNLLKGIEPLLRADELLQLRAMVHQVMIDESLLEYIAHIVEQTRITKAVLVGASPRAAVGVMQAAKAYALLQGRDFVTPDDIKHVAPSVLHHRMMISAEAEMEGYTPLKVVERLMEKVEVPQ